MRIRSAQAKATDFPLLDTPSGRKRRYPESMFRRYFRLLLVTIAAVMIVVPSAHALSLTQLTTKLKAPTAIAFRPGNNRPVVTEQAGRVVAVRNGKVIVLADLSDRVGQQGGEQGLLGIAYSPLYRDNGFVFVNYTDAAGTTQIVRFRRGKYDRFLKGTATTLLSIRQPYANHNGGQLAFGPDGFLYIGTGDGGAGGDPGNRAQSTYTPLGKILRINVNEGDPYAIPASNPFATGGGDAAIWAIGLRNPWRFSFDQRTGSLWVGDVGERLREEVSWLPNPAPPLPNFGWNIWEGDLPYVPQPTAGTLITPVATYDGSVGCSVIGGYMYRGKAIRSLRNRYVFGDFCTSTIWSLTRKAPTRVDIGVRVPRLTTLGQDAAGELYFASQRGTLFRLQP